MPVRIEDRSDLTPPRLYNHFEEVDENGMNVGLNVEDIEKSIRTTVDQFLSQRKYLVVAYVHEGVNLLNATKIALQKDLIDSLINHKNLLGLAVIDSEHSYFKVLIEIAKSLRPALKISIFQSLDELEAYVAAHPDLIG